MTMESYQDCLGTLISRYKDENLAECRRGGIMRRLEIVTSDLMVNIEVECMEIEKSSYRPTRVRIMSITGNKYEFQTNMEIDMNFTHMVIRDGDLCGKVITPFSRG